MQSRKEKTNTKSIIFINYLRNKCYNAEEKEALLCCAMVRGDTNIFSVWPSKIVGGQYLASFHSILRLQDNKNKCTADT